MRTRASILALLGALIAAKAEGQTAPAPRKPTSSNRPQVIPPPTVRTALPPLGVEYSPFEPQYAPIYNGVFYGPSFTWGGAWPGFWYTGACAGGVCGPGLIVAARSPSVTFGLEWVRIDPAIGFQSLSQYWPGHVWGPPLAERDRRVDPEHADLPLEPVTVTPPPAPPSLHSLALDALRAGDFARAAPMLERLAQNRLDAEKAALTSPPPDRTSLRLYAIALAALGRFDESSVAFRRADIEDSSLRTRPIDPVDTLGSAGALRRILNGAVGYANRTNTPEAWVLVGHLMAAEGRLADAQRMYDRAEALRAAAPDAPVGPVVR